MFFLFLSYMDRETQLALSRELLFNIQHLADVNNNEDRIFLRNVKRNAIVNGILFE